MEYTTMGSSIRKFRKMMRISQQELARAAGVAQSTISSIKLGKQNPSVVTVGLIAGALGCDAAELLRNLME